MKVSEDRQKVEVFQEDGTLLGEFIAPSVEVNGTMVQGEFSYENGNLLTSINSDIDLPYNCWRATAAKWIWRFAAGLICGAFGVATFVGGIFCGLAAAGAEDKMNIEERAC